MTHPNPTCETCRWWVRHKRYDLCDWESKPPWLSDEVGEDDPRFVEVGTCHRYSPRISDLASQQTIDTIRKHHNLSFELTHVVIRESGSVLPATWYFDFCGEHSPRIPLPITGEPS